MFPCLLQWDVHNDVKQEGDTVKAGDVILEITTDKLTSEVESEHDGVLLKIVAQEGEDIPVKGLLAYIGEAGEQVGGAASAPAVAPVEKESPEVSAAAPAAPAAPVAGGRIRISPLAKKTAAKLGVDYTTVACLVNGAVQIITVPLPLFVTT